MMKFLPKWRKMVANDGQFFCRPDDDDSDRFDDIGDDDTGDDFDWWEYAS